MTLVKLPQEAKENGTQPSAQSAAKKRKSRFCPVMIVPFIAASVSLKSRTQSQTNKSKERDLFKITAVPEKARLLFFSIIILLVFLFLPFSS